VKQESGIRNNLRTTRLRLGLSQQDLATAAGVTRQTVGGVEAGLYAPSALVALRFAKALGCRVEDLFWLDENRATLHAVPAWDVPRGAPTRLALAQVGGQWIAHPLQAGSAFRTEMVPCDGIGTRDADAQELAVELLDDAAGLARTVALAGCTPALSLWARAAERWHPGLRVHWSFANSTEALQRLACGEVHAAGLHLRDPDTGEYNAPFVQQARLRHRVVLINLGVWEEGLVVARGNPKRLSRGGDLAQPGVTIVNRETGAGSRSLLDEALAADGVATESVCGYRKTVYGHVEVAEEVAAGRADAGVTSACVAAAYGLGFVALREARYDLALRAEHLEHEPVRQLLGTLDHRWVRSQLSVLGGYDTTHTGEVVAELKEPVSPA
jgi:molybdate-binding protein/DNA-binding XRE family transcriptional regulator